MHIENLRTLTYTRTKKRGGKKKAIRELKKERERERD